MNVLRSYLGKSFALAMLSGCLHLPVRMDPTLSATEAHDPTAVVEGCGQKPTPGYIFCRKEEGKLASLEIVTFLTPPVTCKRSSCAFIKIFSPKTNLVGSIAVAKGTTRTSIAWNQLINRDSFQLEDRGLWPFVLEVFFNDEKDQEHRLIMEGEIRLRVYRKGYLPLDNGQEDPNFQWEIIDSGMNIKFTTGGRVYIGPVE